MEFPEEALRSKEELRKRHYKQLGTFGERALSLVEDIESGTHRTSRCYTTGGFPIELESSSTLYAKYLDFLTEAKSKLPNHKPFFEKAIFEITHNSQYYKLSDAVEAVDYTIKLLLWEEKAESNRNNPKLFKSVDDKMAEVNIGFKKEDWDGVMNDLNTALELLLKEKLSIPVTITDMHTGWIIDYLVKINKGPVQFLTEAKNKICKFDNKVKHTGYSADKIDCVTAIKALEDLKKHLENGQINLTGDETKELFKSI
jgi:hypothetical protein